MQFDLLFQNMVSIFVPSFSQKKLERKNDKKGKIGHEPKKFLPFFSSNLESVDRKTPGTNPNHKALFFLRSRAEENLSILYRVAR